MSKNRLTIQKLANLCNFGYEIEKLLGCNINDPQLFREHIAGMSNTWLEHSFLTSLRELLQTVNQISCTDIELRATGPDKLFANLTALRTPAAVAANVNENVVLDEPKKQE